MNCESFHFISPLTSFSVLTCIKNLASRVMFTIILFGKTLTSEQTSRENNILKTK